MTDSQQNHSDVSESHDTDELALAEALRCQAGIDLLENTKTGGFYYLVGFAGVLISSEVLYANKTIPLTFLALLIISSIYRLVLRKQAGNKPTSIQVRHASFAVLLSVGTWSLTSSWVIFQVGEIDGTVALTIGAGAAYAAGALMATMTHRVLQLCTMLLMFIPSIVSLALLIGDEAAMVAVIFMVTYLVYLLLLGRRQHEAYYAALKNSLRLQQQTSALEQARNDALAASKAKSDFLAHMSHEIRTPLNGVIGNAELLATTEVTNEQLQYLITIRQSGRLLMDLINDILDFSRISSRALTLSPQDIELRSMVETLKAMMQSTVRAKGLGLDVQVDDRLPKYIKVDRLRLQQLIINLLSNAIKFTNQGKISLVLKYASQPDGSPVLRCEVSDTGVGISDTDIVRIFDQFMQVQNFHSELRGSGLGLSICKQLVELMSGEIGVSSELGLGSTFWFVIPITAGATPEQLSQPEDCAPEAVSKSSQIKGPDDGLRILLVEDVYVNRRLVAEYLHYFTCSVVEATNGNEALASFKAHQPDLVLMDCNMPVLDGMEATRLCRKHEEDAQWQRTPIVALTAHAFGSVIDECLEAGMDDHLSKPLMMDDFRKMIIKWLPQIQVNPE